MLGTHRGNLVFKNSDRCGNDNNNNNNTNSNDDVDDDDDNGMQPIFSSSFHVCWINR